MRHIVSIDTLDLLVDRSASYDLKCGICFSLLQSPVQCRHGHLFCAACLANVSICPECRVPCTPETVARALFVEKTILSLKLHCVYHFLENGSPDASGQGCPAVISRAEQSTHQATCKYRFVDCEFCGRRLRFHSLDGHLGQCLHVLEHCSKCGTSVRRMDKERHVTVCPEELLTCENCNEQVSRQKYAEHLDRLCLETVISCPFQGCDAAPMKRRLVEEHYREDAFRHLNVMQKVLQEQLVLQSRLLKAKDDRILALETQMLQERRQKMKHTCVWQVPNWMQIIRRRERFVRSKSFEGFPGFKFFLGIFPLGEEGSLEEKISLFLFLEAGSPENAMIEVEFSLSLVNLRYEAATLSFSFENVRFPLTSGEGWGESGVIGTKYITPSSGFLSPEPEAALTINVTFRVINLSFDL